jgi:hypothetical protein
MKNISYPVLGKFHFLSEKQHLFYYPVKLDFPNITITYLGIIQN